MDKTKEDMQSSSPLPPLNRLLILSVRERLKQGQDMMGQIYEDIEIEYKTTGFRTEDYNLEIIIPEKPEKNIDDFFANGIAYVKAKYYEDKDLYLVGRENVASSRWFKIIDHKEV